MRSSSRKRGRSFLRRKRISRILSFHALETDCPVVPILFFAAPEIYSDPRKRNSRCHRITPVATKAGKAHHRTTPEIQTSLGRCNIWPTQAKPRQTHGAVATPSAQETAAT